MGQEGPGLGPGQGSSYGRPVERNPGPVPQTGIAVPAYRAANSQVTSTCLARHLPLKCHSIEGGTQFHIRKTLITWSPLTESNRRPSPYHEPPRLRSRWSGTITRQHASTHWRSQAPDRPSRARFATQSATHFDLASPASRSQSRRPIRCSKACAYGAAMTGDDPLS